MKLSWFVPIPTQRIHSPSTQKPALSTRGNGHPSSVQLKGRASQLRPPRDGHPSSVHLKGRAPMLHPSEGTGTVLRSSEWTSSRALSVRTDGHCSPVRLNGWARRVPFTHTFTLRPYTTPSPQFPPLIPTPSPRPTAASFCQPTSSGASGVASHQASSRQLPTAYTASPPAYAKELAFLIFPHPASHGPLVHIKSPPLLLTWIGKLASVWWRNKEEG